MRALCWHGKGDIRCDTVPDPEIEAPRDAIVRVTSTAICGSDLHLYDGYMPGMESGDIMGHEFMGEVVEVGPDNKKLSVGDRIVVPFTIACGECEQCRRGYFSVCERSNRNKETADRAFGHTTAGLFGYTHLTGGYPGGQAEYVRVPYADVGPVKIPDGLTDEQVLFLSDIFPTGWQAVVQCDIEPTDTVAIWGCGPVGQFCIRSAILLGAERVIAIDRVPERLAMAKAGGAIPIDFEEESVVERLNELTSGKGPEKCIDAVGMEAHATATLDSIYDRAKQAVMLETDRPHVLREMMYVCRPAGVLSVPGVYGGLLDKVPFGMVMNKGLTIRTGQTHVNRWTDDLLRRIEEGQIDPSFVITHRVGLEAGPQMYETFREKQDGCIKVVQALRRNNMTHRHGGSSWPDGEASAQALGQGLRWFSIRLGLADLLAPQSIARYLGMRQPAGLIRLYGMREIMTGLGILSQRDPTPWIWARIGGDAVDLATLATGLPPTIHVEGT